MEGEEQGRGEGTFAQDLVLKRGLAAYACALPCNLKAPQDRTPRSILYWTIYTPQSKRTSGSLHPFQSAQLLLNQHCQKARQHYNKLAPLTICWSCCSIVCLFKTRAHTLTHKSPKLALCCHHPNSRFVVSEREASKGSGLNPCRATVAALGLCLGFVLSLQAEQTNAHTVPAWKIKVSKSLFRQLTRKALLRKRKSHRLERTQH